MIRTPEPQLMDEEAQAAAYALADFEEPNRRFVAWFDEVFPGEPLTGAVVDLGCGPADISARFARRHADVEVDAVDGAEAMLAWGRKAAADPALGGRLTLHRRMLPAALPRPAYDAVISNSLLHHLPEGRLLWDTIAVAAKPGAPVLVMDLMRPDSEAAAWAVVNTYAAQEPEQLRQDFFASLCAAFTVEEVRAQLDAAGLGHLEVGAVSDRHLGVWGRR